MAVSITADHLIYAGDPIDLPPGKYFWKNSLYVVSCNALSLCRMTRAFHKARKTYGLSYTALSWFDTLKIKLILLGFSILMISFLIHQLFYCFWSRLWMCMARAALYLLMFLNCRGNFKEVMRRRIKNLHETKNTENVHLFLIEDLF